MHYANGGQAKNGDRVIRLTPPNYCSRIIVGILHDATPGNDTWNGNLVAPIADPLGCNLAECLPVDDGRALVGDIKKVPDTATS